MKKAIVQVAVLLLLSIFGAGLSVGKDADRFRVPNILRGTADALGVSRGSQKLTSATIRTIAEAIVSLDVNKGKQSRRFYKLCDKLVGQVDAGGLPPGYLWRRFLRGRSISGANLPQQITPKTHNEVQITFSLSDYDAMLNWIAPYLAKEGTDNHAKVAKNGEALIILDMEDLFSHFYITGIASYPERILTSNAKRKYLAANPVAFVISGNFGLRRLFRAYYRDAIRLDYWAMTPTLKKFQSLIDNRRLSNRGVLKVLGSLTQLRRLVGHEQYSNQWLLCSVAWKLLNLAHSRKDLKATATVRAYIESWKQHTRRRSVRRWLSEALIKQGPSPREVWGPPIKIKLAK